MKIALFVLLIVVALGGLVGMLIARDPGYVLVAYQDMAVETSLWFALLLLVAAYLLVRLVMILVARLFRGGGSLQGWRSRRRSRAAREQTVRGLLLLAEGRWGEARKLLENAAPHVDAPLINYLNAARAAHETGDMRRRDELLRRAHDSTPGSRFAVDLTRAELSRAEGQWQACLATTLQLYRQSPRHPQVLRLLASCYEHLEDWQALLELVGDLEKHRVLPPPALHALQLRAWKGRLRTAREEDVPALWQRVPRGLRRETELVDAFARAMSDAGRDGDAEALLRETLEHVWSPELLRLYGTLTGADPRRLLATAERWLTQRPNEAELLLALGRISLMNRQWAKAREYLEASLRQRRSAEARSELGRLCVALGETARGSELLSQGLVTLPPLPMPEPAAAEQPQVRGA